MPYRKSARITVTNEGTAAGRRVLFEHRLHDGAVAARRRALLPRAVPAGGAVRRRQRRSRRKLNPDGKLNYVYAETRGRGHLMGVTLGVLLNADGLDGRGRRHDLRRRRDQARHHRHRLGRLLPGKLELRRPRRRHALRAPLLRRAAHHHAGAHRRPLLLLPLARRQPGHLHALPEAHHGTRPRQRPGDNFFSVCYWYQTEPYTDFPALPPVAARVPVIKEIAHT